MKSGIARQSAKGRTARDAAGASAKLPEHGIIFRARDCAIMLTLRLPSHASASAHPRSQPAMTTEENKVVAYRYFERFTAGDIEGPLDTMTDDATW